MNYSSWNKSNLCKLMFPLQKVARTWLIYIYIFSFPGVDGVPDVQHKDVSHKSSTDEEVGLFLCSR